MQLFYPKSNCNAVILFFFMLCFATSQSQYIIQQDAIPQKVSLQNYASVIDVGQKKISIKTIIKDFDTYKPTDLKSGSDDLGFTDNYWWSKISLQNATTETLDYYFETARPITDRVELYVIDKQDGTIVKSVSGDRMPFDKRDYSSHKTIFKLKVKPKANLELYLHLKSDGEVIKMPLILTSADRFNDDTAFEQFIFGIFYGILFIAAILYFFFYYAVRELTFVYYSLYVFFVGMMQLSLDGYFYKYIDPSGGWISQHAVLIFAMGTGVLLGKYSEAFLRIRQHNQFIYKSFRVLYLFAFLLILFILFIPATLSYCYPIANVIGFLILVLIISAIISLMRKKVKVDAFFATGILFLISGFGIFILNNFGLLPNTFLIQNSSKFGTGLEVIFLSLSMANLIRNLRNERNELNRVALVRAQEMNDLKTYFLSNISHELRTPLNAIMNLIDSVSSEVIDERIKKNCQVIKYSSHSLLSSVNDILDFSKIERKEIIMDKVNFSPLSVIEQAKNNAELRAKDKGLEFIFKKSGTFPEMICGDEIRLVQIINNIVSNAIKFTSEGFVKFEVESLPKSKGQASLILTISDSGVGISKDKMDTIFDSFTQHNIDNKRKFGGLGLGLYIVKTLVNMQGGTISLNSYANKGTCCVVTLDYDVVSDAKMEIVTTKPLTYDLEGRTILVVEDNSINQLVIKMLLKKWENTKFVFANDGEEGLEILRNQTIDIILMDLQMPIMDGYEATTAIRNGKAGLLNSNVPIIAVTADVMETTKQRVFEIGMNDYLSKPINKEELYQSIAKCLQLNSCKEVSA
ncbi:hybrid sensor histidine kinase/response regulator [Flavobacterium algicola]|uniref:hybrid sensor histidine kinase/response regulator n=1 Tax=Flavobacterium algicola TaxID=556529 RepID=UPI001EFCD1B2|nr:hybrid sensor histidine kinase/response regulator [Flavobacterium algicola]MCG9791048.1 response regulator [Flavobacterium algicola]